MKYYLAAKFSRREEMENLVNDRFNLELKDWYCCASWVFGGEDGLNRVQIAELDLEDIKSCDVLIIMTHPRGSKQPGGGRFVEMGFALGRGKKVIVIGPYENVFCHYPGVEVFPDVDTFLLHYGVV